MQHSLVAQNTQKKFSLLLMHRVYFVFFLLQDDEIVSESIICFIHKKHLMVDEKITII